MATDAQIGFIQSLCASRVIPPSVSMEHLEALTVPQASALIETLKAQPWKPREAVTNLAEKGYYRIGSEIYTVTKAKNSDRTYAKILVCDGNRGRWEYVKGMVSRLLPSNRITIKEASEFGHLHGFCLVCGKTLTDPKSVSQGIGPVCITRI